MEHFVVFSNTVLCEEEAQHGGRWYDDFQNLLDMTSHETLYYTGGGNLVLCAFHKFITQANVLQTGDAHSNGMFIIVE